MALKLADRVQETTSTAGIGPFSLHGAVAGFVSFGSTLDDGDTTYYGALDPVALAWEVGLGTYAAGTNTLARTAVLASSNGGGLVFFAGNAGTQLWQDIPASVMAVLLAAQGTLQKVTDGVTSVTNASTIDFTAGGTVTNLGGGVAGVSISGGGGSSGVSFYDTHGHTVTNATTLAVEGSGTIAGSGTIGTLSGFGSSGGGYPVSPGLGLYGITAGGTITVGSTGTIVQPPQTTADSAGIYLSGGNQSGADTLKAGGVIVETGYIRQAGTDTPIIGPTVGVYLGPTYLTEISGTAYSGRMKMGGGAISNGTALIDDALVSFAYGYVHGTVAASGIDFSFAGSSAYGADTNNGGHMGFYTGAAIAGQTAKSGGMTFGAGVAQNGTIINDGGGIEFAGANAVGGTTAVAGGITLTNGTASGASGTNINGGLYIPVIDATDPHILGRAFTTVSLGVTLVALSGG
jgi:hypothetical protein